MKRLYVALFLFLIIGSNNLFSQRLINRAPESAVRAALTKSWSRMPTTSEINEAFRIYKSKAYSNCNVQNWTKVHISGYNNPKEANQVFLISNCSYTAGPRDIINYVAVLKEDYSTGDFRFEGIMLRGVKRFVNDTSTLLEESDIGFLSSGWIQGSSSNNNQNNNADNTTIENDPPDPPEDENTGLWEVVIGAAAIGALIAAIRKRLKKSKKTKSENGKEKYKYILELSADTFQLIENDPQSLEIKSWKITEKGKYPTNAIIRIQNPEKALKIMPYSGTGRLNSQLALKAPPAKEDFNINVTASIGKHSIQRIVKIHVGGEKQIIIKTLPGNQRSLRPNINQLLSCYAKVIDESGKDAPNLTKEIKFNPQSDWLDLSDPIMDEGWIAINIGASDPDANAAVSHPPESVVLAITMEEVPEGENILQNDLKITLLDCKIDTDLDKVTFPVSEKQSEIIFKAFIEDCGEDAPWHFNASYKTSDNKPDDPLTTISIEKVSDIKVEVKLTGPILIPKEGQQYLRKKLVISAQQKEEEPLERHIYVTVSKEGLFIEEGVDKNKELSFTAKGDIVKELEFGLFKYDPDKDEVLADKNGLKNLSFELIETTKQQKNLDSVLHISFLFDSLVTTIPHARYILEAPKEIPGLGEIIPLKYRVKAPISEKEENPENFQFDFKVNVKTYGIGEEFPDWVKAYNQCKYVIDNYVPAGNPTDKLIDLLERRKYTLGAEGLTELRNRIWKIASNLILAEGAKGYESVDRWATAIEETLEWTKWAGDLAFNALAAYYLRGLGAVGASMVKDTMVEALIFYAYDKGSVKEFAYQQYDKIIPLLMNVAKGRLISVENIQMVCKNNKAVAWAIFISIEFLYNLYQTKSVVEAAKLTARQIRDELIIRTITKHLHANAPKHNIKVVKSEEVKKVLTEVESCFRKNRLGGKFIDRSKMLELLSDPAKIRTIKKYGSEKIKKAFDTTRRKIHLEHDRKLLSDIAKREGINLKDLKVDDFRTPGTEGKFNLNTDRDYRVLKRVQTSDGQTIWIEVSTSKWKNQSYKIFGEITNKPSNMTDIEWAEHNQQRGTDRYDSEACADYTDHYTDPKTGETFRVKSNITDVIGGKKTLIDPDDIGRMYKQKVVNAGDTPEAFAQAKKGVHTIKSVKKGYKKQGFQVKDTPENLKKAMKVIEDTPPDADATPERMRQTKKKLNKLGYKNANEVMNHISDEFKALKDLKKPTITQKVIGYINN